MDMGNVEMKDLANIANIANIKHIEDIEEFVEDREKHIQKNAKIALIYDDL